MKVAVAGFGRWGQQPSRFSNDELAGNIRIFEAIVTSSRNNGAAELL